MIFPGLKITILKCLAFNDYGWEICSLFQIIVRAEWEGKIYIKCCFFVIHIFVIKIW